MLNKLTVTYYLLENSVHKYINLGCLPFLQELSAHNFENNCRYKLWVTWFVLYLLLTCGSVYIRYDWLRYTTVHSVRVHWC